MLRISLNVMLSKVLRAKSRLIISGYIGALGFVRRLGCSRIARAAILLSDIRVSSETRHHASDAFLKLAVLGGVDERIDAADGQKVCAYISS